MNMPRTRREFLTDVGRGMLLATVGCQVAGELGVSPAFAAEDDTLSFGSLERLVALMQETPADRLLPLLASELRGGTDLRRLVSAAALANARTFGGEDYVGFHTMMALAPAFHMAQELPKEMQPLPVFKVLYRNTNRIQEHGGRKGEVLHAVKVGHLESSPNGDILRQAVRGKDVNKAEEIFAAISKGSPEDAFNNLLFAVQDNTEVHRVVLPYRAWDLLGMIGKEQAHTLLRQSVRYCVKAESWTHTATWDEPRTVLPKALDEYKLLGRSPGDRVPDDGWVDQMSQTIFKSTPQQAAQAAAAALADGIAPAAIGE